jgi:hypothetical protein
LQRIFSWVIWRILIEGHDNVPSRFDEPRFQSKAHRAEHKVELCGRLDADDLIGLAAFEKEQLVPVTNNGFHGISFGCGLDWVGLAMPAYFVARRAVVVGKATGLAAFVALGWFAAGLSGGVLPDRLFFSLPPKYSAEKQEFGVHGM